MLQQISIITLNTWGIPFFSDRYKLRYKLLGEQLSLKEADFICLQEVYTYHGLFLIKKRLKTFPFCSYTPGLMGPKGGLVCFSQYPIASKRFIAFDQKITGITLLSKLKRMLMPKGILICRFSTIDVEILVVHLSANKNGDWSMSNLYSRLLQSEILQLRELLQSTISATVIVVGDFNIAKGSELYSLMQNTLPVQDVFEDNYEPTYHAKYLPKSSGHAHCIDYILVKNQTKYSIKKTEYILNEPQIIPDNSSLFVSDHIGLYASLSFTDSF